MNQILIAVGGVLVAVLPAAYEWYRCRRLRKLSETRLMIARSTTNMQRLLMNGIISGGQVCHDKVFPLMQKTQHLNELPLRWMFAPPPVSEESRLFAKRLEKELSALSADAKKQVELFMIGLVGACRYRHPVRFLILMATTRVLLLFLKVLLQTFELAEAYARARAEAERQVLTRAYDATNLQPSLIPSMA